MTIGHPEIIRLLAEHGADVNARNCHNNTALHEAAYWGYAQGPLPRFTSLSGSAFSQTLSRLTAPIARNGANRA